MRSAELTASYRRLLSLAAALVALTGMTTIQADAQVVSASNGVAQSINKDMPSPRATAWTVSTLPFKGFSLQYGRRWLKDDTEYAGVTCQSYSPVFGTNCRDETLASRFTIYSRWYGLSYRHEMRRWNAAAGVRRLHSTVYGEQQGVWTRRIVPLVLGNRETKAWGADLTLGYRFVKGLTAFARWSRETLGKTTVFSDVPLAFDQPMRVDVRSLGIEWSPFGR